MLDAGGLITIKRPTPLSETVKPFARKTQEDVEGNSLVETVRQVSGAPQPACSGTACMSMSGSMAYNQQTYEHAACVRRTFWKSSQQELRAVLNYCKLSLCLGVWLASSFIWGMPLSAEPP